MLKLSAPLAQNKYTHNAHTKLTNYSLVWAFHLCNYSVQAERTTQTCGAKNFERQKCAALALRFKQMHKSITMPLCLTRKYSTRHFPWHFLCSSELTFPCTVDFEKDVCGGVIYIIPLGGEACFSTAFPVVIRLLDLTLYHYINQDVLMLFLMGTGCSWLPRAMESI